jgi:hypothetical protein
LTSKNAKIEESRIGIGTDLDRISNVIGNLNYATLVDKNETTVVVHYVTKQQKKETYRICYEIDICNLSKEQLQRVESRIEKDKRKTQKKGRA